MKVASEVAKEMYEAYEKTHRFRNRASDMKGDRLKDLGAVADSIYLEKDHQAVVDALGLGDPDCWPDMDGLPEHFCAYRVFARLVREGLFDEALSFNYDCGFERGLKDEGFLFSPGARGRHWRDHATVVTDAETNADILRRGAFTLSKAHGCAERYRKRVNDPNRSKDDRPDESIIVRWGQLLDWRSDRWARDLLADRARRNVLLLVGFSGQDAVIHVTLTRILQEVYRGARNTSDPRLVVIDRSPDKLTLKMLAREGYPNGKPPKGIVTKVSTEDTSMTAVLLVLLAELLAKRLAPTLTSATDPEVKLAELTVALPTMLRWSFLLRQREQIPAGMQRMNFEQAAATGYVPLTADPKLTARALQARRSLREALGLGANETLDEALALDGLVFDRSAGKAYIPTGLSADDLRDLTVGQIARARARLDPSRHLEAILVAGNGAGLLGRVLRTGAEVTIK
jgi:hypothetical protein